LRIAVHLVFFSANLTMKVTFFCLIFGEHYSLRYNKVGRKFLLYYPNVIRLLEDGDDGAEADNCGGITRQSERLR
jgi:hypothetical protein